MRNLNQLYDLANEKLIMIFDYDMTNLDMEAASIRINNNTGIFIDYNQLDSTAAEKVILGHELGHCETGALHKINSPYELKERNEYRADRWAVHELIPFEDFERAFKNGHTEVWDLAEHFNVTEDFIRTALQIYKNEGLMI